MIYKVLPFVAKITKKDSTNEVANQLENLINEQTELGWEFMHLENVETKIEPDMGCFGIGATPGSTVIYKMAVFKRL